MIKLQEQRIQEMEASFRRQQRSNQGSGGSFMDLLGGDGTSSQGGSYGDSGAGDFC